MQKLHSTPYSTLSDDEFLRQLLAKRDPTAEDVEAALRIEMLMESYNALLEQIHTTALRGLEAATEVANQELACACLDKIIELTMPQ